MKREELVEKLIEVYEEYEDVFNDDLEEFDNHLDLVSEEDIYHDMSELDDGNMTITEALEKAYHGYDEERYKNNSPFCPFRSFFRYGIEGLISSDFKDYSNYLNDYVVGKIVGYVLTHSDHMDYFYMSDEAKELFEYYLNNKED